MGVKNLLKSWPNWSWRDDPASFPVSSFRSAFLADLPVLHQQAGDEAESAGC
jgi:hypothetical protein